MALVVACANPGPDELAATAPPPDPNHSRPSPTPSPTTGNWTEVWEVVSFCGETFCSGGRGFGVLLEGKYYIGKTREDAVKQGTLSIAEEVTVARAALAAVMQNLGGPARCTATNPSPGAVRDFSLTVRAMNGGPRVAILEVSNGGKRYCTRGDPAKAQALREALQPIINRYDPKPMPSPTPTHTPSPFPGPFPTPSAAPEL